MNTVDETNHEEGLSTLELPFNFCSKQGNYDIKVFAASRPVAELEY
jgi:hypothetical protein